MGFGQDNMVLRTIHLPVGVDRKLREHAFTRDISKAELMRTFISDGLAGLRGSGEKTSAERVEGVDRDNKVLRTIYLPVDVDRKLREHAITRDISKAELMRSFLTDGLADLQMSGKKTLAERIDARVAVKAAARASAKVPVPPARMPETAEKPTAAQIRKSIGPDALVSFIDGKPYKMLKRHLAKHGLDMDGYRKRYGLPPDYPSVAAVYSARRSALAKSLGLGRTPPSTASGAEDTPEVSPRPAPKAHRRPKKAA